MSNEGFSFVVGLIVGAICAAIFATVITDSYYKTTIAKGDITCRYLHEQRVCWNPKNEEQ